MNESKYRPPSSTSVFLDTSIFISSHRYGFKKTIKGTLKGFQWCGTASYAMLEYGNNILPLAFYYYTNLKETGDLDKTADFIFHRLFSKKSKNFRDPHQKRRQWFFSILRDSFGKDDALRRAKASLRLLLRVGTAYIRKYCDHVHDGIKCAYASQEVGPEKRWKRPSKANCEIDKFFVGKQKLFGSFRDAILRAPSSQFTMQLSDIADLVDKASHDPMILRDCKMCPRMADALIAAESEGYGSFFTQNFKESDVLCPALRQTLLYLSQDPDQPVATRYTP